MTSGHASGASVVGVTVSFTVIAFIVTVLRLITRLTIVRNAGLDDLIISFAMVFSIVLTITMGEQGINPPTKKSSLSDDQFSPIRHGNTRRHNRPSREYNELSVVLGFCMDLLSGSLLRETVDLAAILAHIPREEPQSRGLCAHGNDRCLDGLGVLQCDIRLHADQSFLESER